MSAFRIARSAARIAIAASCLAIIAASRLFAAPGGGLDNAPAKRKNPNAGKRKAAKRARKARKNAFMFKTFGARPWNEQQYWNNGYQDLVDWDALSSGRPWPKVDRNTFGDGFKQMSTVAGYFQTHAVTDVLNCWHCGGRGTWKDEEKGPTMCLRCKGKGRVIFCKPQWIKYVPSADRYEREMRLREQVAGLYMEEAGRPE